MTKTTDALDRIAEDALTELATVRPSGDAMGAAVAAAALALLVGMLLDQHIQ